MIYWYLLLICVLGLVAKDCQGSIIQKTHQLINPEGKYHLFWNKKRAEHIKSTLRPLLTHSGGNSFYDKSLKEVGHLDYLLTEFDHKITGMTKEYAEKIIKNAFGKSLLTFKFINQKSLNVLFSDNGILIASVKGWMGWTVYTFISNQKIQVDKTSDQTIYTIEYKTPSISSTAIPRLHKYNKHTKAALLKFLIIIDHKRNTRKLKVTTHLSGLSKGKYKSLVKPLSDLVNKNIAYEMQLGGIRFEQAKVVKEENKVNQKAKQMKSMDKILNPEKYKSTSPTVRRMAREGSGRYTPSADTKSRRVVAKGG